jgi:AhpD family alkylhydroperoxidase
MSQRLTGLAHEEATGVAKEVFSASDRFLGRTSNLVRILGKHSPYLGRWFLGLVASTRQAGLGASSDARLRNLANIKTSIVNECKYCTAHTQIYGQGLGITDDEFLAMRGDEWRDSPLFDEREKAVIAWAEAITLNTAKQDIKLWAEMKRLFSDTEIVEISMAAALFNMINRLNDSFWTDLEATEYNQQQWKAVDGLTIDEIEDYASRFAQSGRAQRSEAAE